MALEQFNRRRLNRSGLFRNTDPPGVLAGWANEVYSAYGDDDWPSGGDPIVEDAFVQLVVAPEAWEAEVPKLVERAHRHGLTVVDPQSERLFPFGQPPGR
jgi:hypothetical protein